MGFGLEEKVLQTSLQKADGFTYFTYHQQPLFPIKKTWRLPFRKQPNLTSNKRNNRLR
jgi:hypothetical protein